MSENLNHKKKVIYISWTDFNWHSYLFARSLDIKLIFIKKISLRNFLPKIVFVILDYLRKTFKSVWSIISEKSDLYILENPPPILSVIGLFMKIVKGNKFKYVIDAHNGAFEKPMVNFPFVSNAFRKADAVIVHNDPLKQHLSSISKFKDCNFFTLNDPLPEIPKYNLPALKKYILVVTTFHGDEPIETVLEGVKTFLAQNPNSEIQFRVTGNFKKNPKLYEKFKDSGIVFLGFLNQEDYFKNLTNSLGIISYSIRERVQQYALMEALGADLPFISNNNLTNNELFGDKMVLTKIDPVSISEGINDFLGKRDLLLSNIPVLKKQLAEKRKSDFEKIIKQLEI